MTNVLRRPPKNYAKFKYDDSQIYFTKQLFDGEAGELPLFLVVNVGYDSEDDNHKYMEAFESGELLFAFKRGVQKRVLIHDSHSRTLSLPLTSPLTFNVRSYLGVPVGAEAMTVSDIVENMKMPVAMSFARKDNLVFDVDRVPVNHTFFGELVLVAVYEEPFFCCLSIGSADGKPREKMQVLPRRLNQVAFSLVDGLVGVKDPHERLKLVIEELAAASATYSLDNDPFFQELAIVDKQRRVMTETEIPDYMEQDTFIDISYKRRDAPDPPGGPPAPPPRQPTTTTTVEKASHTNTPVKRKNEVNKSKVKDASNNRNYETLAKVEDVDSHVYDLVSAEQDGNELSWKTQAQHPLMAEPVRPLPLFPQKDRSPARVEVAPPPLPSRDGRSQHRKNFRTDSDDGGSGGSLASVGSTSSDIGSLTIDEVCERLQDLGLGKYSKKFRKHFIDGNLLTKLTDSTLKDEFKMNKVEILRLRTFINEGHIPR